MPTDIRIIHARDFVKVTPDGRLDLERARKVLIEVASTPAPSSKHEIILDTRKVQLAMSETDLWYLATELISHPKAFLRKMAVLCPLTDFNLAGFFALCAQNRGFNIQAFTSFEDAVEWLFTDERSSPAGG